MQHNYTDFDTILFVYDELDSVSKREFEKKLEQDIFLKEEFDIQLKTIDLLDLAFQKPHPTTVDLILEYSRSKSSEKAIT